jgi:hypothetical protein
MPEQKKNPLLSRKFLVAVATIITTFVLAFTGKEVDPQVILSVLGLAAAWITGETVLDRKAIEVNGDFAKRLAAAELNALYQQLFSESQAEVPSEGVPVTEFPTGIAPQ